MRKRIVIEGDILHKVGYRPFLLHIAHRLKIASFDAENIAENGKQKIIVSVEGKEDQVQRFLDFIRKSYPEKAKVSEIREIEPPETVISIKKYESVLSSEQQNTIIQTGLEMVEMQKDTIEAVKTVGEKVDTVGKKVDVVGEKVDKGFEKTGQNFVTLRTDYGKISHTTEKILERLASQEKDFTDAVNGLTGAILELAKKKL